MCPTRAKVLQRQLATMVTVSTLPDGPCTLIARTNCFLVNRYRSDIPQRGIKCRIHSKTRDHCADNDTALPNVRSWLCLRYIPVIDFRVPDSFSMVLVQKCGHFLTFACCLSVTPIIALRRLITESLNDCAICRQIGSTAKISYRSPTISCDHIWFLCPFA